MRDTLTCPLHALVMRQHPTYLPPFRASRKKRGLLPTAARSRQHIDAQQCGYWETDQPQHAEYAGKKPSIRLAFSGTLRAIPVRHTERHEKQPREGET